MTRQAPDADERDRNLVESTLAGDRRAFGQLVTLYQRPVYNAALKILKDTELAADVAQTTFLKAYEQLNTYNPQYRFFSWLYRIAVNTALNEQKKVRDHASLADVELTHDGQPDEKAEEVELEERVGQALMGLNPEDRALILLRHYQNFSYDDLGFVFDIPSRTVKSRLYTARQRLREICEHRGIRAHA